MIHSRPHVIGNILNRQYSYLTFWRHVSPIFSLKPTFHLLLSPIVYHISKCFSSTLLNTSLFIRELCHPLMYNYWVRCFHVISLVVLLNCTIQEPGSFAPLVQVRRSIFPTPATSRVMAHLQTVRHALTGMQFWTRKAPWHSGRAAIISACFRKGQEESMILLLLLSSSPLFRVFTIIWGTECCRLSVVKLWSMECYILCWIFILLH